MIVKASGRSALILATGLFVCFAGPSQAAGATDPAASATAGAPIALNKYAKHTAHHGKKLAQHKSGKVASKPSTDTKAAATDAAADDGDNSSTIQPSQIPPAVANANAQLASADASNDTTKAMAARASSIVQAATDGQASPQPPANTAQGNTQDNTQVVSADQLNDVDRSLREGGAAATPVALASADTPAATMTAPATATASNESTTWDQTSLIGKIFIGFGALLTMASAARMFMA
jgi:hypothetical protein